MNQTIEPDVFSRPLSIQSALTYHSYGNGILTGRMNIDMTYNDAGQMTSRSLLPAQNGNTYGETLKYEHPRGWLTSINKPSPRSFDTQTCEEPTGDVYASEPESQPTNLTTIFDYLANGNDITVDDLECTYPVIDGPCIKEDEVTDYTVSIPNPIKYRKGEFINAAGVTCPVGTTCSQSARNANLESVSSIRITGLTINDGSGEQELTFPASYSLNSILLSNQTEGIDKPALNQFRQDVINVAANSGWFVRDVKFNLKSNPDNCGDCPANGAKNYSLNLTFKQSNIAITKLTTKYEYDVANRSGKGDTYSWRQPTRPSPPVTINVPCPIIIGGGGTEDPKKVLKEDSMVDSRGSGKGSNRIVGKRNTQGILRTGSAAGARNGWVARSSRISLGRSGISETDSLLISDAEKDNCETTTTTVPDGKPEKSQAGATRTTGLTGRPGTTRFVALQEFLARVSSTKEGIRIVPKGGPFTFHQNPANPEELELNDMETTRLKESFRVWLSENDFDGQEFRVKTDEEGSIELLLSAGELELVYAITTNQYAVEVTCPDMSSETFTLTGEEERIFAYHTSTFPAPAYAPDLSPRDSRRDKPVDRYQGAITLNKDEPKVCPDQPDPKCTATELRGQLNQVANFYNDADQEYLEGLAYPNTLYRVELCDGSFAYLLQEQLDQLTGNYNIVDQLPVANADSRIDATFSRDGLNQLFALELDYEPNGNIRWAKWKTTYHAPNTYRYRYDVLNRLKSADYNPSSAGPDHGPAELFSVSNITYDEIGNIETLNRMGISPCNENGEIEYGLIDQLTYGYDEGSSKLVSVLDEATGEDFKNQGVKPSDDDYGYDASGRMVSDPHRGLTIEYNHLDLPRLITGPDGSVTEITYDATGRKWLQKKTDEARMYTGPFTFISEDNAPFRLEALNTSDGRIVYDDEHKEVFSEYHHKDHLGNIRLAFTDRNEDGKVEILGEASEITQQNDFYPFGLGHEGFGLLHGDVGGNRYRFNGKEFNEDIGLYDYGARWYDPAVARWTSIDPLAENRVWANPYNFVQNNPIVRIDPDGLTDYTINRKTGGVAQVGEANDEPDRVLKTNNKGEIKYKKNGDARVAFGGIEQGILQDGMNFKEESNAFAVGGEGQPSEQGVEAFALKLSIYVGKEIGGAYFSKTGDGNTTHITIGKYKNNQHKETKSHGVGAARSFVSSGEEYNSSLSGFFHTHPSDAGISDSDRLVPSGQDRRTRDKGLASKPWLRYYLLTQPEYGRRYPRKIDYTTGYPASERR